MCNIFLTFPFPFTFTFNWHYFFISHFSSFFFQLKYTIIQPAVTGSLHQLSQVFSKYGYEPKNGEKIITSETNVRVTGSNNRIIYSRPMYGSDTNNKVRLSFSVFLLQFFVISFRLFCGVFCRSFYSLIFFSLFIYLFIHFFSFFISYFLLFIVHS